MLTAQYMSGQVHLVVGANSLAASRCSKCLEAGAKPVVLSNGGVVSPTLFEKINESGICLIQREFQDDDLITLGREEVDRVVDAVFVTLRSNDPLSMFILQIWRVRG